MYWNIIMNVSNVINW